MHAELKMELLWLRAKWHRKAELKKYFRYYCTESVEHKQVDEFHKCSRFKKREV
jgi:hypothetical protein